MTPWVLRLLVANVFVYLLQSTVPGSLFQYGLIPALVLSRPWTMVTYMFLHGSGNHILWNMLGLYFFGPVIEAKLGNKNFLSLYFASGLAGGLLSIAMTPHSPIPIVGASGALFGLELAFAYYWPRVPILLFGIVPIEARWMVVIVTVLSLGGAMGYGLSGGVAHFAHLGGFAGGYLFLKWMEHRAGVPLRRWRDEARPAAPRLETAGQVMDRWSRINREALHPVNRDELDRVLDKIRATGLSSLTSGEREFLDRFSARP